MEIYVHNGQRLERTTVCVTHYVQHTMCIAPQSITHYVLAITHYVLAISFGRLVYVYLMCYMDYTCGCVPV